MNKKFNSIEKSLTSVGQRSIAKKSYSIELNPVKAKKLLKAHICYIVRDSAGDSKPFDAVYMHMEKDQFKKFPEGPIAEITKTFRIIISPENAKDFANKKNLKVLLGIA